jgi:hypothetical protein
MRAIKEARRFIEHNSDSPSAQLLAKLVLSLENETNFLISEIYDLDLEHFNLALSVLREWRLDRYYAGKGRLFDLSLQVSDLYKKI